MIELTNGTELGIPKVEDCKVRLSDGVIEDTTETEWTVEEIEEMIGTVETELAEWKKLLTWLKAKP